MYTKTGNRLSGLSVFLLCALAASAQGREHWVATWTASPVPTKGPIDLSTPSAPARSILEFHNQTIRMVVNTSIGGRVLRVALSNVYGNDRLKIGAAHIGLKKQGSAIVPGSDRTLTFGGADKVTIPVGAVMISDPVALTVPALSDLVVSIYFPQYTGPPTSHPNARRTTYISGSGDFTAAPDFTSDATGNAWYFLSGVHVLAPADTGLIVALGDSITNGDTSTLDGNASWPGRFAMRLRASGMANLAIVNQGISGNSLLVDGGGVSTLARFERDVLSQPGIRWLVFLGGINDIMAEWAYSDPVTVEEIVTIYKQVAERAHMHNIAVAGATLTPYAGTTYYSESADAIRLGVNQWIRNSRLLDTVIDFDAAVRDRNHPTRWRAGLTDDYLHPNDAGYKVMADSIDLTIFRRKR